MRISEKTFEATVAAQLSAELGLRNALWIGLTQKQERHAGFDLATAVGKRIFFFQFKASNTIVQRGFPKPRRRFNLPHQQMTALQRLAGVLPDAVYYLLPDIGTTSELRLNPDVLPRCWLLNVADLKGVSPPQNKAGNHCAYIDPPFCEVRSEAVSVTLTPLNRILAEAPENVGSNLSPDALREWSASYRGRRLYALAIP